MSTIPTKQIDHPAYDVPTATEHYSGTEFKMPNLNEKSYSDKYDIMDNNKVKLDRPMPDRGN